MLEFSCNPARFTVPVVLTLCLAFLSAGSLARGQDADIFALQRRVVDLFEQNHTAVVRVMAAVEEKDETGETHVARRVGTGFFISRDGHVVTNANITHQAIRTWVEHDGVEYAADLIGLDLDTNFALLKLMSLPPSFTHLSLTGNPSLPPVGSFVIAMGCPLEFSPSPTLGSVTGHESSFSQRVFPVSYARINIPAHPGEGGSPVIDLSGRLVGMMVASLPEVNSSYVLPAKAMLRVRDDLLFSGKVEYGWVGFELEERRDRHLGRHIVVDQVFEGTPAEKAGILPGDRLVRMGDTPVSRADDVRNANFHHRVGDYMAIRVMREGEPHDFSVRLVSRPDPEKARPSETAALDESS